jgi:L-threonylcarbamoyladenylate synthase
MRMTEPYDEEITRAAELLRSGGLVAFPTETVYGLGADAANSAALRRLYAVKGRPASHPVIVHVARTELLDDLAVDIPDAARVLAHAFWPGPLTLVVKRRPGAVADEVTGGRDTVGVRVPNQPQALALLDAFGGPVAAPSANRFGKVSPTTAAHVRSDLGDDVDLVLDGGPCRVGVESTIVDVSRKSPAILRVGGVTSEELERVLGARPTPLTSGEVAAPGTLAQHYAPNARLELVAADELDARIAELRAQGTKVAALAAPNDPGEYARVLYARLRAADALDVDVIVAPIPSDGGGIAVAVRDRLFRAARR